MIPFPNISPEIFLVNLFGVSFALRWYAISYIIGFLCALKIMNFLSKETMFGSQIHSHLADQQIPF